MIRPTEMSSKIPVSRNRVVFPTKGKLPPRDPRFDDTAGRLDEARFRSSYSFIDNIRDKEIEELQKAIKKEKKEFEKQKMQKALQILQNRRNAQQRKDEKMKLLSQWKKKEAEKIEAFGKTPFYLKQSSSLFFKRKKISSLLNRFFKKIINITKKKIKKKKK